MNFIRKPASGVIAILWKCSITGITSSTFSIISLAGFSGDFRILLHISITSVFKIGLSVMDETPLLDIGFNRKIKRDDIEYLVGISFKTDLDENIINIKYKWGGKHFTGVDCSGLIQLFLNFNNKYCPRDTKDQIKYFKKKIELRDIRKNDLIFWKGHVAIVISKSKLIHAYGPFKKVVVMSIKKTINRIYKLGINIR